MITLSTIRQASEQEVFDQVAAHLLKQGERSVKGVDGSSFCRYRGPHGLMCAAGCLIGPEEYEPCMEGDLWCDLFPEGDAPHEDLVMHLQNTHDSVEPRKWAGALATCAETFHLKFNPKDYQ